MSQTKRREGQFTLTSIQRVLNLYVVALSNSISHRLLRLFRGILFWVDMLIISQRTREVFQML